MSDDRPVRYVTDEGIFYRASGLAFCDKVFIALHENYTPASSPAWFQEVLDEGTRMESEIVAMYQEKVDDHIVDSQREIKLEVLDGVFIIGHIDGLTTDGALFEAKKFRESTWMKFKRQGVECMPWYPWQVSAYMHGLEVDECEFTGGFFDGKSITDIYTHHLAQPPLPLIALTKRVAKLEALINGGKQVDDVDCTIRQFPCPFHYLHAADDEYQRPVIPPDDTILPLLTELQDIKDQLTPLNKQVKDLGDRKKELTAGIHGWLELAGVDDDATIEVAGYEAKYHTSFVHGYTVEDNERLNITVKPVKVTKASKKAVPRAKQT